MNDGEWLVGVVGDASDDISDPTDISASVDGVGAHPVEGDVETVLEESPDLIVTAGEQSLFAVARECPTAPVLPIDAGRGFPSVTRDDVGRTITHAVDDGETLSYPVVRIEHDGAFIARAVTDVTLLSAQVAQISEYRLTDGDTEVARFRADGVVVATPAGSRGYARRVGSPIVSLESGVGVVAPIAPFATNADHWVLPLENVRLTVERDETEVSLLADDREVATVSAGEPVRVAPDGSVDIATVSGCSGESL